MSVVNHILERDFDVFIEERLVVDALALLLLRVMVLNTIINLFCHIISLNFENEK